MKRIILTAAMVLIGGIAFAQPYMIGQQGGCTNANSTVATCQQFINWQTQQQLIAQDNAAIHTAQAKLQADEDAYQAGQATTMIATASTALTTLQSASTATTTVKTAQ